MENHSFQVGYTALALDTQHLLLAREDPEASDFKVISKAVCMFQKALSGNS